MIIYLSSWKCVSFCWKCTEGKIKKPFQYLQRTDWCIPPFRKSDDCPTKWSIIGETIFLFCFYEAQKTLLGVYQERRKFKGSGTRAVRMSAQDITIACNSLCSSRERVGISCLEWANMKVKVQFCCSSYTHGCRENVVWENKLGKIPMRVQVKCDFVRLCCTFYATLIHHVLNIHAYLYLVLCCPLYDKSKEIILSFTSLSWALKMHHD